MMGAEILNSGSAQPARNLTTSGGSYNPDVYTYYTGSANASPGECESLTLGPGIWLISVLALGSTANPTIAISDTSASMTNIATVTSVNYSSGGDSTYTVSVITLKASTTIYINSSGSAITHTLTFATQIG